MSSPLSILVSLLLLAQFSFANYPDNWINPKTERAIQRTLTYYFYGDGIHDIETLTKAYHPQAYLTYVDVNTGKYEKFHVGDYLSTLAGKKAHPVKRILKVRHMDITGHAAQVKTEIIYPDRGMRINDYLTLHYLEEEWRIVSRTSYKEFASFETEKIPFWKKSLHENHQQINQVLEKYLEGGDENNPEALKTAFHPQADLSYIDPRKGTYHSVNFDDYLNQKLYTTPEKVTPKRNHEIQSVDITGNIAVAKIRIRYKRYKASVTDYVSLIKSDGKWRIIHKATDKEKKAILAPV